MTTFKEGYPQARDMEGIERAASQWPVVMRHIVLSQIEPKERNHG